MRFQLLIIFTFLYSISFAQQVEYNGELVDTLIIKSHQSVYQFDNKGTTKGEASILMISFNFESNAYTVCKYYHDKYTRTFKPDTITIKTKDLIPEIDIIINNNDIISLLKSLNNNVDASALINHIDTTAFLNYVSTKQIRKIAKIYDIYWIFNRIYSTKEDNQMFFSSCKSIDSLDLYLNIRFNTKGYNVVTDFSNTFNICIPTVNSEYRFEGKYPNPYKQPWYNHSDTSQFTFSSILNFDINKSLQTILPNNFFLINTISNKALFYDYIIWCFERRDMI